MTKLAFDITRFRTFAAFRKDGAAYLADYTERGNQLSKIVLASGVLEAVNNPGAKLASIADGAFDGLSANPETFKNYRSQLVKALSFAIGKGILPVMAAGDGEAVTLAKIADFCERFTLRGLYDAARAPAQAKTEETKAKREVEAKRVEDDARQAAGVEGEMALSVAKLFAALAPWQEAASLGDANAVRVLEALEASLAIDRAARDAAAQEQEQLKIAA